ncbi:MAG: T9SS type A sorting domain-containing protein [Chitinophagales bacterium]
MKFKVYFLLITVFCLVSIASKANDTAYVQRQQAYITQGLANFNTNAIVLQAYAGVPVNQPTLDTMFVHFANHEVNDFGIVQLIRTMYLGGGQYDSMILHALDTIPFWLTKGERFNNYWSENHMIMWMSSDWLLHERFGRHIDANLHNRLVHYLNLKVQYGFYEFNSAVYGPYCLSGLINLADFAQDAQIKNLATQASQKLLARMLMLTNDQGVYFPSAGRNYFSKYESAWNQNHSNLIWLLTGLGPVPGDASHAGAFLATSSLPVDAVINSRTAYLDTIVYIGHPIDSMNSLHAGQSEVDKTIFQWSAGGYLHPQLALETYTLLTDSDLWNHVDFSPIAQFSFVQPWNIQSLAESASAISKSSVICEENIYMFKHNGVTLSSAQDFWKGKVGYQQQPCAANVGRTAVLTASGKVKTDWNDRSDNNLNNDLPYVKQKKNVALLMYRPEAKLPVLSYGDPEVSLFWRNGDYNEIAEDSMWLLGRVDENYVAVRRYCIDTMNGLWMCPVAEGQSWVIMVGDSSMYGSFTNFKSVVHQSQFEDQWYYDSAAQQYFYYAKVVVDTTTIEYAWGVDSVVNTGISNLTAGSFGLYPNPATGMVTLNLSSIETADMTITVNDLSGRLIYSAGRTLPVKAAYINTEDWAGGVYIVTVETSKGRYCQRLIKQE